MSEPTKDKQNTNEAYFAKAFSASPNGLIISRIEDGLIREVNQSFLDLFGLQRDEVIGCHLTSVGLFVDPQDQAKALGLLKEKGRVRDFELAIRRRNGEVRTTLLSMDPLEIDGESYFLAVMRDMTDEKKAEADQQRLAAIVESSMDAIIGKNLDGIVTAWNKAAEKLFGYKAEEMIGKHITILIPLDRRQEETMILGRIRRGEPISHYETIRMRKDGRLVDVSLSISPIKNVRGEIVGASKIARDVSERKRLEEQAKRFSVELEKQVADRTRELTASNRELEAFCYSVSHDLRAPLRSISGFSGLIMDTIGSQFNTDTRDYFDRIQAASRRMAQLIDNLLELSRVSRQEMKMEKVDMSGLARTITAEIKKMEPNRSTSFVIQPDLTASGDPTLLRLVLQNLLENGWKFTSKTPESRIELGTMQKEGRPIYFVRDNGAGFDMAYYGKLFGAFHRLHGENEFPGTGIGLATVQRIIQRHGGGIWGEGRLGQGATFYFTLGYVHPDSVRKQESPQDLSEKSTVTTA